MKPRNIVLHEGIGYAGITDFLASNLGFERVRFSAAPSHPSKLKMLWVLMVNTVGLLRFLGSGRKFGDIVVFGHTAIVVRLLERLKLLSYSRMFYFAFFFHSPRWMCVQRLFLFDSIRDHYVTFSEAEIPFYSQYFGIDQSRMHFLRYGDWSTEAKASAPTRPECVPTEGYYFAGGYSNRDYLPLIEAFRMLPASLVIVCSSHNKELNGISVPHNIRILRDLPGDIFDSYIHHAKAVIIPLKHDTGASGQSVMLRTMRNKKAGIATNFGAVRDYIEDGVTGFLIDDIVQKLPPIIRRLESEPGVIITMGTAAYALYERKFSYKTGFASLRTILSNEDLSPAGSLSPAPMTIAQKMKNCPADV
jgi:glycosyltransferase involved in cell wall biosynthesis